MRQKAHTMVLFTNRNCMVFDADGHQITRYQKAISCYKVNPKLALQATQEAEVFRISCFRDWTHDIRRENMQYLLGIRTPDMDLADIERR